MGDLERMVSTGAPTQVRDAFRRVREHYKFGEALAEYYAPQTAQALNGPAIDRSSDEPPYALQAATGLQVMEGALFPDTVPGWRAILSVQVPMARRNAARLRDVAKGTEPTDGHIFEAARLEIARVVTLGLAGFDAGRSGDGTREGATALRGVRAMLSPFAASLRARNAPLADSLDSTLRDAAVALDSAGNPAGLDRLRFIVRHAEPAARAVDAARRALTIALPTSNALWTADAATLFERGAFDAAAFAPSYAPA